MASTQTDIHQAIKSSSSRAKVY